MSKIKILAILKSLPQIFSRSKSPVSSNPSTRLKLPTSSKFFTPPPLPTSSTPPTHSPLSTNLQPSTLPIYSKISTHPTPPTPHQKFLKLLPLALSALLALTLTPPASALTEDQKGAISQNCGTIRQSLRSLQKADSRARVLLGTTYNTILTNYITPLNLRLVRNNYPAPKLADLQSDFAEAKTTFARTFVTYSQSLEELIAIDCQKDPEDFYKHLATTRTEREKMAKSVDRMNALVSTDVNLVKALREEL